ncbi:MAG: apolipoprotein N-acyltransferase [Polyangia bacterium]
MRIHGKWILLLVSAALYVSSYPPLPSGALAWVFLLPFFELLRRGEYRGGFRWGLVLGLIANGGLLYWMSLNNGASTGQALSMHLLLTLYLAIGWGVFGHLLGAACRRFGEHGIWAAPVLWTGIEYLYSFGDLAFTWTSLATTQTGYPELLQYITVTGMYGVTFWAVLLNVLIHRAWRRRGWREAAAVMGLILLPLIHGYIVMPDEDHPPAERLRVAAIQPNVNSVRKFNERNLAYLELMKLTGSLESGPYDLVVWPETATPILLEEDEQRAGEVRAALDEIDSALMTGAIRHEETGGDGDGEIDGEAGRAARIRSRGYRSLNSVLLLRPDSERIESYDKLFLVPFGETVPSFMWFMEDMLLDVGIGSLVPGEETKLLDVPIYRGEEVVREVPTATAICLEGIYSRFVRGLVRRGAELLVVLTNDAWYDGTSEPHQHARIAVLRAVEHRIAVVRCANSGISAVIDPYGRVRKETPAGEQAVLESFVEIGGQRTAFTAAGEWLPIALLVLAGALSVFLLVEPRLRRRRG